MGRQIDHIELFLVPAVLHNWCNKGCGMCYPVCGMVHIKEPLLLIRKSSLCSGSTGFPLLLCQYLNGPLPYVRRHITINKNVLSESLNKTFTSFLSINSYKFVSIKYYKVCVNCYFDVIWKHEWHLTFTCNIKYNWQWMFFKNFLLLVSLACFNCFPSSFLDKKIILLFLVSS